MRPSPVLFALLAAVGCSSSGPDARDDDADDDMAGDTRVDAGVPEPKPDAALDPDDDGTACTTAHGDLGVLTGKAVTGLQAGKMDVFYRLQVEVALEGATGVLGVELWQGFGAFADGVKVGDFPLTDDDADPLTCGACVFIARDGGDTGPSTFYLATGGMLRVASIEGAVSASIEDATFTQFDPETGVLATTGCARSIDGAALSGPLEQLPVETCDRRCGQEGELPDDGDGCFCDDRCVDEGDCCGGRDDFEAVCGDPDAVTSCAGACGYQGPLDGPGDATCYCDAECLEKGDCCGGAAHYDLVCDGGPAPNSCSGSCGGQAPAGCFCDYLCVLEGDCCPDLFDACF